jgi:5'-methylthioadenosine phosphorylase
LPQASVPVARLAVIGGSATQGGAFPGTERPDVAPLDDGLVFETPYGDSPPFQLFTLAGEPVLHVRMHGWRPGVPRGLASRQVFSVLHRAGVRRIVSEAGVGSLDRLLDPGDLVVCDDFVDLSTERAGEGVVGGHLLIMREPVCPVGRAALAGAARRHAPERRLFTRGVYVVTEGPRFESPAEVRRLRGYGDVVGQSFSPEVWLARDIGACYAGIYLIVNYAEGVVEDWSHEELKQRFTDDAGLMTRIVLDAAASLPVDQADCHCRELRKPTLLA